jgi:hypothetical protein
MNDEGFPSAVISPPRPGPVTLKIGPFTPSQAFVVLASVFGVLVMIIQAIFPQLILAPVYVFGLFDLSIITVLVTFPLRFSGVVMTVEFAVLFGGMAMAIYTRFPRSPSLTIVSILLFAFSVFMVVPALATMVRWARHQESFEGVA